MQHNRKYSAELRALHYDGQTNCTMEREKAGLHHSLLLRKRRALQTPTNKRDGGPGKTEFERHVDGNNQEVDARSGEKGPELVGFHQVRRKVGGWQS